MGFQLWMSATTGYRRNGTRFDSLQKIFFDNVTVKEIYEPLLSCKESDLASDVNYALEKRNFDMVGVIGKDDKVIGCVYKTDLLNAEGSVSEQIKEIDAAEIISESTSLVKLLSILHEQSVAYISKYDDIVGLVNRYDIDKPPVRIYVFGMLSLFEMHLSFWLKRIYKDNLWESEISKKRLRNAKKLLSHRLKKDKSTKLVDCLQLGDKKAILGKTSDFINKLPINRRNFRKLLENVEVIRNDIAHSQNSIISTLDWSSFTKTLFLVEELLLLSDKSLEEKYERVNFSDSLIAIPVK